MLTAHNCINCKHFEMKSLKVCELSCALSQTMAQNLNSRIGDLQCVNYDSACGCGHVELRVCTCTVHTGLINIVIVAYWDDYC